MGKSNLRVSLERKYAGWRGEHISLQKEITQIVEAYETLDEKRNRMTRLDSLIESSEVIMSEIAPEWSRDTATVRQPRGYNLPFEIGSTTRLALDVLRRSSEPMTSRAISRQMLAEVGMEDAESDLVDRVRAAVDSTMRTKNGKIVEGTGEWPIYWAIKIADPAR